MTTKRIFEAGSLVESQTDAGKFRIRIITEGEGSSGVYSRELLENYGKVFANRAMFGNHPKDPNKPWERSPFEIKAKLGAVEYEVVDGVGTLYGEPIMNDEVRKWVEDFHDVIGVSIFASGDGHEDPDTGKWIVESFDGSDPYTSVDFVVAPGRGGGVERVMEAWRSLEDSAAPAEAGTGKERTMDEATKVFFEALFSKLDEKIATLQESVESAVSLVESVKDAQPERVEAVDAAGELATAVAEAQLGEKAVHRVLEAVKGGKSVVEAVTHEKEIRDEVLAEAKGRLQEGVFGGATTDDADYKLSTVRFS